MNTNESNLFFLSSVLRVAANDCQSFGLSTALKWISEQLVGIKPFKIDNSTLAPNLIISKESSYSVLARCLLQEGEYQRCSHILKKEERHSQISLFLLHYSSYLAGEKFKMQMQQEQGNAAAPVANNKDKLAASEEASPKQPRNPYLHEIFNSLYPMYISFHNKHINPSSSDEALNTPWSSESSSSMHGLLMFLFAIVVRDLLIQGPLPPQLLLKQQREIVEAHANDNCDGDPEEGHWPVLDCQRDLTNKSVIPPVYTLFLYSIHLYPWNW